MELYHYLPNYPDFTNTLEPILRQVEDGQDQLNPYLAISRKREFNDCRLPVLEERPTRKGQMMLHQSFLSRFMSSYTPYNGVLLMHEPGTGKTCASVGIVEAIRNQSTLFTGALVIMKGRKLIANYINELLTKCTADQYWPSSEDAMFRTDQQNEKQAIRNVKSFYEFQTFEKMSRWVRQTAPSAIAKRYSNHIIIIDEVHNLREADTDNQYKSIHTLLHLVKNCKIILMSGTPMRDKPSELKGIMNLILPDTNQITDFSQYVQSDDEGNELVNPATIDSLKTQYLQGRVSYVKAMQSGVSKKYEGSISLGAFTLFPVFMKAAQQKAYSTIIKETGANISIYSNHTQASLCVAPGGQYGKVGFGDGEQHFYQSLIKAISANEVAKKIENLGNYSAKYAQCISILFDKPDSSHFIYNNLVDGSGINLFCFILERVFGYSRVTSATTVFYKKAKRFVLVTGSTSESELDSLKSMFNNDRNQNGEYIHAFIGSQILAEGFTLKNVQNVHILSPSWNFSETDQVIARAVRFMSHFALEQTLPHITVSIYLYCCIMEGESPTPDRSIDYKMWSMSQQKDRAIKSFERVLKESCVDCIINKDRNVNQAAVNGSRECDYQECDYKCDGVDGDPFFPRDNTTYQLYYDTDEITSLRALIPQLFHSKRLYQLTLDDLYHFIKVAYSKKEPPTLITVIKTVCAMIRENDVITNQLGYSCFLRSENDYLYLTHNLKPNTQFFDAYYASHFMICQYRLEETVLEMSSVKSLEVFRSLLSTNDLQSVRMIKEFLPEIQEIIIEMCIILQRNDVLTENQTIIDFIIKMYEPNTVRQDDVIGVMLPDCSARCLVDKWRTCGPSHSHYAALTEALEQHTRKTTIPMNQWGYVGLFNLQEIETSFAPPKHDRYRFYIYEITEDVGQKMKRGFACHQNNDITVIQGIARRLGINIEAMPDQRKKPLCDAIRNWFVDHALIYDQQTFKKIDLGMLPHDKIM